MTQIIRGALPQDLLDRLESEPPVGPAVYFLFRGDECVYVGSSSNPAQRIESHRMCRRDFDRALFLPVGNEVLAASERQWIAAVCPRHNYRGNPVADESEQHWGSAPEPIVPRRVDSDLLAEFGRAVRFHRLAAGMTQAELAARMEPPVAVTAIARYEAGKTNIIIGPLCRLATALDVCVCALVPGEKCSQSDGSA